MRYEITEDVAKRMEEVMTKGLEHIVMYGQYFMKEKQSSDYIWFGKGSLEDCFIPPDE